MHAVRLPGFRSSLALASLVAIASCDPKPRPRDGLDAGHEPSEADGGMGADGSVERDAAELTVEQRCARADEEAMITRPEGWAALSHCKYAPADGEQVFPAARVGKLVLKMTRDEFAAMSADLADALIGAHVPDLVQQERADDVSPQGIADAGPAEPEGPDYIGACIGKSEREACEIVFESGSEAGICVPWQEDKLGCKPNSWRPPAAWILACDGKAVGDACTTTEHEGHCVSDTVDIACQPDEPGSEPLLDPCQDKAVGDSCTQGTMKGRCRQTTGLRICEVNGFEAANVDDVPVEAAITFLPREPKYFRAELEFAGARYTSVGIRYKGNNSLVSSTGPKKPFRLKLDEWEDENSAVTDQRLFGFQHLSFTPNHSDGSNLHQVLAAELFRAHGVPAPLSSFVEVYLDSGDGPVLLGLYAMSELPDDQLTERVFDDDTGNMYKPDGRGAHFVSFVQGSMHKQNNEEAGYGDVQALVRALHAKQNDREAYRAGLRAVFDIDAFAEFFAVNQAIANWDSYGALAHNFYLYGEPKTGRLHFLPWDFDLSFDGTGETDLTLRSYEGRWPLLQAVARDVEFATRYTGKLSSFAEEELASGKLTKRIDQLTKLITPAIKREDAVHEGTAFSFEASLEALKEHVSTQKVRIADFLASQD